MTTSCSSLTRQWKQRFFLLMAFTAASWQPALGQTLLLDDFDEGLNPNWQKFDLNIEFGADGQPIPRPWGPGVYDTSSGSLNMRTTGPLPPRTAEDPYNSFDSGNLAVLWAPSAVDPRFSNGIARSTLKIDSPATASATWLRGNLETNTTYVLGGGVRGDGSPGPLVISVFENGSPARAEIIPGMSVVQGEEWSIEASAIGDHLSLKAWRATETEPFLPQLTITDTTSSGSILGLGAGLGAGEAFAEPTAVNVMRDNVSFSPVAVPSFSGMVVFGDSLTDVGNVLDKSPSVLGRAVPKSPPYFEGRLSNGPVWIEHLAARLGVESPTASETGGMNFAWGGATTGSIANTLVDDMDVQLQKYLAQHSPAADQLFVLYGGANDLNRGQSPKEPVEFIGQHIRELASNGATQFMVPNMAAPLNDSQQDLLGQYSEFNALLSHELAELRETLGVTIYEVDTERMMGEIVANPEAFGFSNITNAACSDCGSGLGASSQVVNNPESYLLWDNVHYSARGNEILGDGAFLSLILPGDVNNSGRIDAKDIDAISLALRASATNPDADMNLDGVVTEDDRSFWLEQYARTMVGDANLDGAVNFADFLELSENFGMEGGWAEGNFTPDPIVGFNDFLLLADNFESGEMAAASVPEASSLVMLGIAIIGGSLARRRPIR